LLTSFNPFTDSLKYSATALRTQDRQDLSTTCSTLLKYYEGCQLYYLHRYLARVIKDPDVLGVYQALATFQNFIRLLVDRVSTLGQLPVRVIWANPEDQKLWDDVSTNRFSESWDALIPSISRKTELCKTAVVLPSWNQRFQIVDLNVYTPNTLDVDYAEGNHTAQYPDAYKILANEDETLYQVWDFTSSPGQVYYCNSDDAMVTNPELYAVIDSTTGRILRPFIPFRTDVSQYNYFVWDGQTELIQAQEFINRCYTQLSVLLHFGAFKMPILSGGNWTDAEGRAPRLSFDISKALLLPDELGGTPANIRWDGPSTKDNIDSILSAIEHWAQITAATFRINPSAITVKSEASSGYALQIESAALKTKHAYTRTLARRPLTQLVNAIKDVWNNYNPSKGFSSDAVFSIDIPDYGTVANTSDEVKSDLDKLNNGIISKRSLIYKYNPGINPEEATKLDETETPIPTNLVVSLVQSGVIDQNEAREMLKLEAKAEPVSPADPGPEETPNAQIAEGSQQVKPDVQSQALNGAQMASLQAIVQGVAAKQFPSESAIQLVMISFPGIDRATASALITPATSFQPPTPTVPPVAGVTA